MTKPTCVCDLCDNGTKTRECYVGGVSNCLKKGAWTLFVSKAEAQLEALTAQRDLYSARVGELEQGIRALIGEVEVEYCG